MSEPSGGIIAGASPVSDIPSDRLTAEELGELQRLVGARKVIESQLQTLDQRLELLVLGARDRRGLTGRVRVQPETGAIAPVEEQEGSHGV